MRRIFADLTPRRVPAHEVVRTVTAPGLARLRAVRSPRSFPRRTRAGRSRFFLRSSKCEPVSRGDGLAHRFRSGSTAPPSGRGLQVSRGRATCRRLTDTPNDPIPARGIGSRKRRRLADVRSSRCGREYGPSPRCVASCPCAAREVTPGKGPVPVSFPPHCDPGADVGRLPGVRTVPAGMARTAKGQS